MKKQLYIWLTAVVFGISYSGCTDDFEAVNTNPNKLYNTDFKYVFPGTVLKTMRLIGELNYTHLLNNSRMATIQYSVGTVEDTSDSFYKQAYIDILRDLAAVKREYAGKEGYENRLAMAITWEAYIYYILVSTYGPVPMSDALMEPNENQSSFKYDSELQVYTQILNLLKEAGDGYQPASKYLASDCLKPDYVFNTAQSNIAKWQKLTNTFRLNVAMHIQNLSPELSQQHAAEVMQNENLLMSSNEDNAAPHYGTVVSTNDVSYYYNRFLKNIESNAANFGKTTYPMMSEYFALYLFSYNDPRIENYFSKSAPGKPDGDQSFQFTDTITRPHICAKTGSDKCSNYDEHQADGFNSYRRDSILVSYSVPYVPAKESLQLPTGWEIAFEPGSTTKRYDDPLNTAHDYNLSRVHLDYLKTDATVIIYNYADACFLKAEAKIKFGLGAQSAQEYYEEGVRASFAQYGRSSQAGDYLAQPGIAWDTDGQGYYDRMGFYSADIHGAGGDENHLEQIYKQRTIGDFFNGLEAWNLERRTRAFRWSPIFQSNMNIDGMTSPVYSFGRERLNYPLVEMTRNATEYYNAIALLQAASPHGNPGARWGDNTVTALAFTQIDPEIAVAESKYGGYRQIIYHAHYYCNYWGTTYEELLAKAKAMAPDATGDSRALTKAFNYKYNSRLKTYYWQEPPIPEEPETPESSPASPISSISSKSSKSLNPPQKIIK